MLCGSRWGHAEDAFFRNQQGQDFQQLERAIETRTGFAVVLRQQSCAKMEQGTAAGARWFGEIAGRYEVCHDPALCAFALRLASWPFALGGETSVLFDGIRQNGVLMRGARLVALRCLAADRDHPGEFLPRWTWSRLQQVNVLNPHVGLNDLLLAILLASKTLNVRLRPELKAGENFSAEDDVEEAIASGAAATEPGLLSLMIKMRSSMPPQALLEDIVTTVQDPFLGLEALALASICERSELTPKLAKLAAIPGLAETAEAKIALAHAWLRCWRNFGFWLAGMPSTWRNRRKRRA